VPHARETANARSRSSALRHYPVSIADLTLVRQRAGLGEPACRGPTGVPKAPRGPTPDCHVVFAGAYYSGPHRLIGQRLWVRATAWKVELYQDYALVATHRRARPGQRRTLTAHLPPDKVHFLLQTPAWCRTHAAEIGPACGDFIERLLGDRPLDRLRSAQGILRLGQRYSPTRLDAACARALAVGEYRHHTVKTIVKGKPNVPRCGK